MRNYLIFDGHDSRDYGVYISGAGTFNSAGREYENIEIPGRDGSLLGLEHRLTNARVIYPAFVYANFKENIAAFRNMLSAVIGYARLTDTYNPTEYRMAVYKGGLSVSPTDQLDAGRFNVEFEVMPQRWLIGGEAAESNPSALDNPSPMPARPLIVATGPGAVVLGDQTVTITDIPAATQIYIDCEMMDCYTISGGQKVNANSKVSFTGNDFPTLPAGRTGVSFTVSALEVTPRWWRV